MNGTSTFEYGFNNSGIIPKLFVPSEMTDPTTNQPYQYPIPRSNWPTLGELLDNGKQAVVFMDSCAEAGQCSTSNGEFLPYILSEFEQVMSSFFDY